MHSFTTGESLFTRQLNLAQTKKASREYFVKTDDLSRRQFVREISAKYRVSTETCEQQILAYIQDRRDTLVSRHKTAVREAWKDVGEALAVFGLFALVIKFYPVFIILGVTLIPRYGAYGLFAGLKALWGTRGKLEELTVYNL